MLEDLLKSISSNPAYLAVTIVLMSMIAFSVIKRLYKLVTLGITLLIIYYAYIILTDQQPLEFNNLPSQIQELQESAESIFEENAAKFQEKKDEIKDSLNSLK